MKSVQHFGRKILITICLVLAVIACAVMPRMVESTIPTAYYITPNLTTYENNISCTGTVLSADVRQIVLSSAAVAEQVFVSVGDTVKAGEVLVKINEEKTGQMGIPISLIKDLSDDIGASGSAGIDWAALASSYGLSAAVSGSSAGFDAGLLDALLADSGLLDGNDAAGVVADLTDGEILSPIAGVVTAVDIQQEVPTASGKAVITVADNKSYKVLASVREEDIGRVQQGDMAKVRGVGFSGVTYEGVVTKIHPTARKTLSGTSTETVVDVEIELINADKRLKPGFSAKVEIMGGNDYNLITVPYEAIKQDENNNEYVYLYVDGKLKKQIVVTGQELTDEVEILDGVTATSVVVYNPSDAIKEGAMINLKGRANVD